MVSEKELQCGKLNSSHLVLSDPNSPRLCVIARTFEDQLDYFPMLAFSLRHSGFKNIRLYVVNTDNRTNINRLRETVNYINIHTAVDFAKFIDLGPIPLMNQHGYGVTDQALRYLYDRHDKDPEKCTYLLLTNGDNLYSKSLGKHVLPHILKSIDIISWGFVSHHGWPKLQIDTAAKSTQKVQYVDDSSEKCLLPAFAIGSIDFAAVMYRFEILYKHKMFYKLNDGSYSFTADGEFIERVVAVVDTAVIVTQTLMFHQ